MKIKITVDLDEEQLRVLREIVLYCGDNKDCRVMPVDALYKHYKVSGGTISHLISEYLIEGRQHIFVGDELHKHDVYPTAIGRRVVNAAKKVTTP